MTANEIREMQKALIEKENNNLCNRILMHIKDFAENDFRSTQIIFDFDDISEDQSIAIALALALEGYTVKVLNDEDGTYMGLEVSWAKKD